MIFMNFHNLFFNRLSSGLSYTILGVVLSGILMSSCATLKNPKLQAQLDNSNCYQHDAYTYSVTDMPEPLYQIKLDTLLTSRISVNSLNIANAIGILDILKQYILKKKEYEASPTLENRVEVIELSQKINKLINLASLEISAVASELDCEEEKTEQIVSYIKSKESNAESKLTIATIAVGAATAILAGTMELSGSESKAIPAIGLGAGVVEGTLGLMMLFNERKMEVRHTRNILNEIWEGKATSKFFPISVWYYLNYHDPAKANKPSHRQQIIDQWMSFDQFADQKEEDREQLLRIYFGEGGKYTADQLKIRTNMYDQLESTIKVMKQDLKDLLMEIDKLD